MRKHIVNSPRMRLLPLAAGLAIALAHGPLANARSDGHGAPQFQHHQDEAGTDILTAGRRLHRQSPLTPEQSWRNCRTIVVRNCNDHGSGTLRDAVASAGSGDTIDLGQLHCSAITLTSGAIDIAVDDLTIKGSRHHALRIDGNDADRVLSHFPPTAGTLTVSDLTIKNGRSVATSGYNNYGGCILANGALTLKRVQITGCDLEAEGVAFGGGVYAYTGLTVTDSTISANTAHSSTVALGGGIFTRANATISGTTISGNAATAVSNGGGVVASGGGVLGGADLDMTDSAITGNEVTASSSYAGAYYGAIANVAGGLALGKLSLTRSTVSDNAARAINTASDAVAYSYAYSIGGGMRATSFMISESTVSGNSTSAVASNPMGIAVEGSRGAGFTTLGTGDTPVVSVVNSTISGNTSSRSETALYPYGYCAGGGFFGNGGTLDLNNSTIAFNTAESGGGIFQYMTSGATAESTIVAKNSFATGGSDFDVGSAISVTGANNLVMSSSADLTLPGGTLSADPRLASLTDNGGPTLTHALRSGSPAINAGNNVAGLRFDQRGHGFPRKVGHATDIGAFEKHGGH